ncbi:MAG: hypothetical protein IT430_18875 [Phycisphaerales bacterium]|nr:hypothetical protein [Phycisphaerales bacterium]
MTIRQITIKGERGDIEIRDADYGAQILFGETCLELSRHSGDDERWAAATATAKAIYGSDRHGRPRCTNSEIHAVRLEIERVAGC